MSRCPEPCVSEYSRRITLERRHKSYPAVIVISYDVALRERAHLSFVT
ncbi:Piso0_004377 [Millerozyma farinosa CBS 7064]|uniref:Piso0_004377 protein n=1 Tax=Pichia sorbitophila (strain ATCC MYA-4447 / BCRC 22081 / CBS 7064 / NBRC 10061 / NRRL Y-12695) TaxID=559304 RepID=G8Y5A9_PICSO|nr:Piso0_004377 [Millerozyma farinosa CBS 7064]CCE84820.1 Piso0_004377 [Millerozyma farinosa CBS 7064]